MKPASDTALTEDNDQRNLLVDYATTDNKANRVTKANEAQDATKVKNIYKTLSDVDQKIVGKRRRVSRNLLTIPWWWSLSLVKRFFILMVYIFLTGAQFAFAMAGNSMALSTDAVCRLAQIFSHFVSILPYVFPNSRHNFRNQVVAFGVSAFVYLGAIMVFFVDALEDIYYQNTGSVSPLPVIVFGCLGFFMSQLSLGCYNIHFKKLDKETRIQGSGTFVTIDSVRAIILIIDASLMFSLTDEEIQIDAWSTIMMCIIMFWTVINDLSHWKEFATPFTGRKSRHDSGVIFEYYPPGERDVNFQNTHQIRKGSSAQATAATSGDKVKEAP